MWSLEEQSEGKEEALNFYRINFSEKMYQSIVDSKDWSFPVVLRTDWNLLDQERNRVLGIKMNWKLP